jgi:hypothetical protein
MNKIRTHLKITHTEYLNDGVSEFGTILNFDNSFNINNKHDKQFSESFAYYYKAENYIIFKTLANLFDFMLYGDTKTNRAYLSESDFDLLYDDYTGFYGTFNDQLEWCIVD